MNQLIQKKWFPHLAAVLLSLVVIAAYFNPILSGKQLKQHDVRQWRATYEEIDQFQKTTGERTFWTNSIFSGMPTFLIGPSYKNNFTTDISNLVAKTLPNPTDTMFLLFICFYIMLLAFEVNPWLAMMGSLAFMLSTFNFLNIDAGHVGKGNAIAFMPLVIAGIRYTLYGNKWFGALLTGVALSFQLTAGHLQITYYLMLIILFWMLVEVYIAFKQGRIRHLAICGALLAVAAVVGLATNATNLLATEEYGAYSIRGKSELTRSASGESTESIASTGLDKDYALQWSNGVAEPFTLLIPNFFGGASNGELSTSSETYNLLKQNGVPNPKGVVQNMPLYWGSQPMTGGPIYYGAIICFLFILGFFTVKGPEKWWIVGISALAIALSMGKNFMALTDLFFYYFPLYNKFRSVTFILCITQTTFPLLAMLALRDFVLGKLKTPDLKKALLNTLYITGGICLFFALLPGLFFDFISRADEQIPEWLRPALVADRQSLMQTDAIRSLVLILLAFGLLWLYLNNKIKKEMTLIALSLLVVVDLWQVDKRYLNDKDFESRKKEIAQSFPKSQADEIILQDPDPHYRVYNTTQRLDQDALTSFWHKSIGGYHGAKMRRYQEFIEFQLAKGNPEAYNMINVKYFIIGDSANNLFPQRNPDANGNAWFVKRYIEVPNADAEMDTLSGIDTKESMVVDKRYGDLIKGFTHAYDSTAFIRLTSYAPNKLLYEYESQVEQLAAFSEIYYDQGWKATIDGKDAPYFRCNYILRGMKLPAGKHQIEWRFDPPIVAKGERISLMASLVLYGGLVLMGGWGFIRKRKSIPVS